MFSFYLLDAHTLLWYLTHDKRLGEAARQVLEEQEARFWLPAIALSEALFVLERKPHLYDLTEDKLLKMVAADPRISIADLDAKTVLTTLDCKAVSEMHDRQIVATALLAQSAGVDVAILTRDESMNAAQLVPTLW